MSHRFVIRPVAPTLCTPLAALVLSGCMTSTPDLPAIDSGGGNPASLYCESRGGTLAFRESVGYCTLPDGQVVEEWTLYRAEAKR